MTSSIEPHLRWMIHMDIARVLAIEQASFDFAWTEDDFIRSMHRANIVCIVVEDQDHVVGYMVYEFTDDCLHIHNFAVDPDFRRQGVGRALVAKLIGKLSSHRRTEISLMVRESNLPAQLFFRDCGFKAVEIIPCYYHLDSGEDAYWMSYTIKESK